MSIQTSTELSNREIVEFEQHKVMFEKQAELQLRLKELEIEHLKVESKFNAWFSIPIKLIKLPVLVVLALSGIIYAIRGKDVPQSLLELLKSF